MHLTLAPVPLHLMGSPHSAENSASVRERVEAARAQQRARYNSSSRIKCNGQANNRLLLHSLSSDARNLLNSAAEALGLSGRAYNRVIKVARTIADLAREERIGRDHVAEALRFRSG